MEDDEPKYGLAVTGVVHPEKITTNSMARPGDILVLTKPLGTGIINTAIKGDIAPAEAVKRAVETMQELNDKAAGAIQQVDARACTDITGFGLLGHAAEMAEASKVTIQIQAEEIPLLPSTLDMAAMGMIPAGAYNNHAYLAEKIRFSHEVRSELHLVLCDPQTSGGLLISVPEQNAGTLVQELTGAGISNAAIIGKVVEQGNHLIEVM